MYSGDATVDADRESIRLNEVLDKSTI